MSYKRVYDKGECRICLDEIVYSTPAIYICNCKSHVHKECLKKWILHKKSKTCELCNAEYKFGKLFDSSETNELNRDITARKTTLPSTSFNHYLSNHLLFTVSDFNRLRTRHTDRRHAIHHRIEHVTRHGLPILLLATLLL